MIPMLEKSIIKNAIPNSERYKLIGIHLIDNHISILLVLWGMIL